MADLSHVYIDRQPDCILPKSFFEGRFIPNFHPDSLDFEQWWDEQVRRAKEGWSDGGYNVTGPYYHHLNFTKINMLAEDGRPVIDHPFFAFEDQQLFVEVKEAREDGQGLMIVTYRGFGKSFDASTICNHEFLYYPATEIIVSASTAFYADKLWSKIKTEQQNLPDELRPSLLSNDDDVIEEGYKGKGIDRGKVFGLRTIMNKVVYGNNPGRTRSTRPNIHVFEEIGAWTGSAKLKDCYDMTESSWWRGSRFTCFPLLIGTGGEMKTGGSKDARSIFWNPEARNLKVFHIEKKGRTYPCAKFVGATRKLEGFYEKSGISDEKGALEFLINKRKKKESDEDALRQEKMEFCLDPDEAFMVSGSDWFTIPTLERRYSEIERNPELKGIVKRYSITPVRDDNGNVVSVRADEDKEGIFEIAELPPWCDPYRNPEKPVIMDPIANLYIGGCDSFDAVEEGVDRREFGKGNKSSGVLWIFKRLWNANETGVMFVAKLKQRTRNGTEFYDNTILLNMLYNSRMLYEHTKIGIGQHYITTKRHDLLLPRPRLEKVDVIKKPTATNTYGIVMPKEIKKHAIKRYSTYLDNYIDNVYFSSQLLDAINFQFGDPAFDETMAAAVTILADDDMHAITIDEQRKEEIHFPHFRTINGRMVFN